MRKNLFWIVCVMCLSVISVGFGAQSRVRLRSDSNPLNGTWSGEWGANAGDRNMVNVDLKYDGKTVTGIVHSVNPQRPDVDIKNGTFDAQTGAIHMDADASGRGQALHYVIDGTVTGKTMAGSWNHEGAKDDFKLTKNQNE